MKKNISALNGASFLWVVGLALFAMGSPGASADEAPVNVDDAASIAAGKALFNQTCVACHGYEGTGGRGNPLKGRTDFTPDYLFNTITNGRRNGARVMPSWKSTFDSTTIWQITSYVWSLRGMPDAGK
jgi:cytochrome c oxidase cbb3-type subunit 3